MKTLELKQPATSPASDGSAIHGATYHELDDANAKLCSEIAALSIENRRYKAALERISKWFDEFPPTGRTWDDGTAMSYSAAFGSNGERDFMRQVAADALSPNDQAHA
jgi:hypothetical protein